MRPYGSYAGTFGITKKKEKKQPTRDKLKE